MPEGAAPGPEFYADVAVIAYHRAADDDVPMESLHPKMTASAGTPDEETVVRFGYSLLG